MSKNETTVKKTNTEIMAADIDTLTDEEVVRKMNLANLRKAEREIALVEEQNDQFALHKEEKKRKAVHGKMTEEEERSRLQNERSACYHKSGGKGRAGFFQGDGRWGYTVATQVLPTSEVYFICFRCQNEWHMPKKRDVINGVITVKQYYSAIEKYNEVAAWPKPLYDTESGEIPGATLFRIPRLEQQRVVDDREFEEFLAKQAQPVGA